MLFYLADQSIKDVFLEQHIVWFVIFPLPEDLYDLCDFLC